MYQLNVKTESKMKKKNNHIVYKVQNKQSGEVYIGATTNSIRQRQLDHTARSNRGEQGYFHESMATYGPEAFTWTQIDTANSIDELAQKEKEYILLYDSKDNGYNSDVGGGVKKTVYQYSIQDGSLINTFDCLDSAANAVSANKRSISSVCLGVNKTCKGYYWSYQDPEHFVPPEERKRKVVIQMDLEGNILAEYNSVAEASRITGVSNTCISRCCRGERKQSSGYLWRYNLN